MAGYIGSRASVVSSGAERKKTFDITGTTTSLTGLSYTPTFVHLFHNGVRLVDGTDYTATNGTSITLTTAAQSGDQVVVVSYATFQAADAYTKAEADAEFVSKDGDTITTAAGIKDLYLSGGVYLGGTGSANRLDSYEEGNWTPVISSTNGFSGDPTPSSTSGKYTKIGNFVRCTGDFTFSSAQTHTDYSYVGGLPFLSNAGANTQAAGVYNSFGANDQNPTGTVRVGITSSQFSLLRLESAPNTSNNRWIFAFSYHTDA